MNIVRTVADLRRAVAAARADGRRIALVPTMGALHEGHLSLVDLAARRPCRCDDAVRQPPSSPPARIRRLPGGTTSATPRWRRARGAYLVRPGRRGGLPARLRHGRDGRGGPSRGLEGAARPEHFGGVATVVTKLLLAARPDRAVFGQKDAQQVAVVRRLMRDLHLDDVELVVGPTVREPTAWR